MESNMYLMSIDRSKVLYRYDVTVEPELKQKVRAGGEAKPRSRSCFPYCCIWQSPVTAT
jgi:hypothetical protein